jgi:hypothetical protein
MPIGILLKPATAFHSPRFVFSRYRNHTGKPGTMQCPPGISECIMAIMPVFERILTPDVFPDKIR